MSVFIIVQGLLSDDYVTQGYGTAVVPPPPPPPNVVVDTALAENRGATGGYLVLQDNAILYPRTAGNWTSSGFPNDEDMIESKARRRKLAVAVALAMCLDEEELL